MLSEEDLIARILKVKDLKENCFKYLEESSKELGVPVPIGVDAGGDGLILNIISEWEPSKVYCVKCNSLKGVNVMPKQYFVTCPSCRVYLRSKRDKE